MSVIVERKRIVNIVLKNMSLILMPFLTLEILKEQLLSTCKQNQVFLAFQISQELLTCFEIADQFFSVKMSSKLRH